MGSHLAGEPPGGLAENQKGAGGGPPNAIWGPRGGFREGEEGAAKGGRPGGRRALKRGEKGRGCGGFMGVWGRAGGNPEAGGKREKRG